LRYALVHVDYVVERPDALALHVRHAEYGVRERLVARKYPKKVKIPLVVIERQCLIIVCVDCYETHNNEQISHLQEFERVAVVSDAKQ